MADVAADVNGEISADGAGGGIRGLGGAEHHAAGLDGSLALPDHAAHRAGAHVVNQATEKALGGKVRIVVLQKLTGGGEQLEAEHLEALLLEALDDLADKTSLNPIGLDHDVSAS
eukprot:CAMPEP_0116918192 /NCGR_PEP_ID=MMETSP0467-20121206/19620_1 /TAXON_ID=283647 /ORGANISM="Mesodinium pulex, Strain SPMC105" /LENGTH=114 /DNA_ID=CAMNT_0004595485 /DNA_START=207 /DNA_END=551 /DNA_ORIENTATION=-